MIHESRDKVSYIVQLKQQSRPLFELMFGRHETLSYADNGEYRFRISFTDKQAGKRFRKSFICKFGIERCALETRKLKRKDARKKARSRH